MKNFAKIVAIVVFCMACISQSQALVKTRKNILNSGHRLWVTSFISYPPFGTISKYKDSIDTVFQPVVDVFNDESTNEMSYFTSDTYEELVFGVISGKIDVLLGAYYDTREYDGIELIYPSLLNNPLVLVTMPNTSLNIKSKSDLIPLKGAIDSREYLSGHVKKELKKYNIKSFDNSEKLYEQLFVGNVDYILTSRYYGAIEQAKLGIRNMVIMSKNALWDMPMFIGTSSVTRKGKVTANTIKDIIKAHTNDLKSKIEQNVIDAIQKADEEAIGVVPPAFVK